MWAVGGEIPRQSFPLRFRIITVSTPRGTSRCESGSPTLGHLCFAGGSPRVRDPLVVPTGFVWYHFQKRGLLIPLNYRRTSPLTSQSFFGVDRACSVWWRGADLVGFFFWVLSCARCEFSCAIGLPSVRRKGLTVPSYEVFRPAACPLRSDLT